MLVSAIQWSESAICICILSLLNLPSTASSQPSHLGHHRAPSWAPCATELAILHMLVYIYINPNIPVHPSLPFCTCVHMSTLYFCISISVLQTGSPVPLFQIPRFHTCALIYNICFSFSDLIHSIKQILGPSKKVALNKHLLLAKGEMCTPDAKSKEQGKQIC